MIVLNISSHIDIPDKEVLSIFIEKKISCQLTKTISSVPDKKGEFRMENGYHILIFEIDGLRFKKDIWTSLEKKLELRCAYVQYNNEYMGCVRNWPGVFVKSKCHGECNLKHLS